MSFEKIWRAIGMGMFDDNSHPVHPATVHMPIAFLSLTYGADTLYGLYTHPAFSRIASLALLAFRTVGLDMSSAQTLAELARVSYISNALGLMTSVPAVLSGVAELYAMIQGQGLWEEIRRESDGHIVYKGLNPKVRVGLLHAALNDVAVAASVWQWWTRRSRVGHMPDGANVLVSMVTLPGLMFSAYLGGSLVYKYGVAVMRMGEAKRIKEDQQRDELKRMDGNTQRKERKGQ